MKQICIRGDPKRLDPPGSLIVFEAASVYSQRC